MQQTADMKRILSIPVILCMLALGACAAPESNSGAQFGTIASDVNPDTGPVALGTGTVAPPEAGTTDTADVPVAAQEEAKPDALPVPIESGPPTTEIPIADQQEP